MGCARDHQSGAGRVIQIVLSLVPWWAYAAAGAVIFAGIWSRFGSRPAIIYAALALAWVAYDKGGDDRQAHIQQEANRAAQSAIDRADRARERSDAVPAGPDGLPDDGHRRD